MPWSIQPYRRAGVPLLVIETADPAATIVMLCRSLNGKTDETPIIRWDSICGYQGLNEAGVASIVRITNGADASTITNPTEALAMLARAGDGVLGVPEGENKAPGVLAFFMNAQRYWNEPPAAQAIWNCRDKMKGCGATLALLATTTSGMPDEFKRDVALVIEGPPISEELRDCLMNVTKDAGITVKDPAPVVDALLGFPSLYGAEQAVALNLSKDGLNVRGVWQSKVGTLRDTAGLEIKMPVKTFADLAGTNGAKHLLKLYLKSKRKPRIIFQLDEIEKMIAGNTSDLSGVTQKLLEQFLYWTEDRKVDGAILFGIPGAGKSATIECTAGEAGIPLGRGSMSTVQGGVVGQSEANMRRMLAAVDAVGQGNILMLATCNGMDTLPPEVQARFRLGTFFYDYPTAEEAAAIWKLYMAKYKLTGKPPAGLQNWVGREIEAACYRADLFGVSLAEACSTIVPLSVSNASRMLAMRQAASGRYQSAAQPGVYRFSESGSPAASAMRKVTV